VRYFNLALVLGIAGSAVSISAQEPQTVVVPNVINEITVGPTPVEIFVQPPMSDSAMIANLVRNNEALRELILQGQECNTCGSSNVVRAGQGVLVLIAAFMAWQVKKIADKPNGDDIHHEGDTNVEVTVEERERRKRDDDHGES